MKEYLIWILLFTTATSSAQEKVFLNSGKTFKIEKKYYVNEIILNSDSTFIQRYYEFREKNGIESYKNSVPEIESNGTYSKSGKYYLFDQKSPNDFVNDYFKLTENKLIYLYCREGKWRKGARFKLKSE
ncbi:hypothetical protein BTO06_11875 [Tenacibaculum sp. SZ-18]|uniref:hypothetical protein n=1 Tax=Tenacibaculum sp. SZ-18 TaxID=754423 RepID=UPI000C2D5F2A|nr:hypothetical protein [Tenacibaculum sp. SZ-18]AUC15803.1 hypothetical protein BTO06_11875 [Tenacibaculum sp. SZ-18]